MTGTTAPTGNEGRGRNRASAPLWLTTLVCAAVGAAVLALTPAGLDRPWWQRLALVALGVVAAEGCWLLVRDRRRGPA